MKLHPKLLAIHRAWLCDVEYTVLAQYSQPAPYRTVLHHWVDEVN